tara:strand:+ start:724 stop:1107 length:384 start_codon:yes stop_codon:yes gene_type:complete
MPKVKLTKLAEENDISFEEAMEIAKDKLPEDYLTGKGKNTWVCEDGQEILVEAFDVPELVPKFLKGRVQYAAPNPHYVYAYIPEIQKKVPVVISKHFKDRLIGKNIDIEAIQDNKGVSYRHAPKRIR